MADLFVLMDDLGLNGLDILAVIEKRIYTLGIRT